jgi:hypothetical protein
LVRCELARVPVSFEVFRGVAAKEYGLNPNWLATGKDSLMTVKRLDFEAIRAKGDISSSEPFSKFYQQQFRHILKLKRPES